MLVDNSRFSDLSDIFDTELYTNHNLSSSSNASSPHLTTPPQDPHPYFPEIHDDDNSNAASNLFNSLFEEELKGVDQLSFLQPSDFMSLDAAAMNMNLGISPSYSIPMDIGALDMSLSFPTPLLDTDAHSHALGIDPQLVDTPSAISDHGDDESDDAQESPTSEKSAKEKEKEKEKDKPTITIAPLKAGGHGKSRKGTVQSGGITKRVSTPSVHHHHKEKENSGVVVAKKASASNSSTMGQSKHARNTSFLEGGMSPSPFVIPSSSLGSIAEDINSGSDKKDDDDDLPQDWRPPPEVFARMSSKEKRQLRNKISARNFRIRRKEYITTLEGDIAERDRLLDHFRTQLGTRESENLALRQEIAALKKALLEGRGGTVNLPPPGPIPSVTDLPIIDEITVSTTSTATNTNTNTLLTPNTQKDLPSSPRLGVGRPGFWGGVAGGSGSGITPVHTTLVPDISTILRRGLMENMNPALNSNTGQGQGQAKPASTPTPTPTGTGFEGFAELNPFTMKTLDAYRMHLWGKMASQQQQQQHHQQQQPQQQLYQFPYSSSSSPSPASSPSPSLGYSPFNSTTNLASHLRPHFFSSSSSKFNHPTSSSLSTLLSGKHAASSSSSSSSGMGAYPTPGSPMLHAKALIKDKENHQQQKEKEQAQAMLAAMASQTILRKLGNAFWDAFTGASSSPSTTSPTSVTTLAISGASNWDTDKVKRVLEGKAVLKVVDVDVPPPAAAAPNGLMMEKATAGSSSLTTGTGPTLNGTTTTTTGGGSTLCPSAKCLDLLEESMRSLTLGKKP